MLAHSQGTSCRVVHFGINTTAPAVGPSRLPQKTTLRIIWYHMLVSWLHEPEKQNKMPRLVLVRARTAVKIALLIDIAREKSNPTLWNHIFKLQRQCRGASGRSYRRTFCLNFQFFFPRNLLYFNLFQNFFANIGMQSLPNILPCYISKLWKCFLFSCFSCFSWKKTEENSAKSCSIRTALRAQLKLWQSDGMSYKKNTQVEVLPVVHLCKKIGEMAFFCGRCNTGVPFSITKKKHNRVGLK